MFATAVENFIFRGFNPFGQASRSEYWIAFPLIWVIMLFLLWLDMGLVIDQLANREKPSLNPLSYSVFTVFVLTLIPRVTLTMRRLQDAGYSPKWAFAPYTLFPLFIGFCVIAAIAAFTKLTATISDADDPAVMTAAIVAMSLMASKEMAWEVFFALGTLLQQGNLFDLVLDGIAMLSLPEIPQATAFTPIADPDVAAQFATQAAQARLAIFAGYCLIPLLTCSLWLAGILSPSKRSEGSFRMAPQADPATEQEKKGHNPYAAYALLAGEKKERTATDVARDKAEVRALYKQRVLGQKEPE